MEAAIFDDLTALGRRDPQPDARAARAPRADGAASCARSCSCRSPRSAVISRRWRDADWVTSRRDGTSRYYTLARRAAARDAPRSCGRSCASRSAPRQPPIRTPGGLKSVLTAGRPRRRSSSRPAPGSGTGCARRCSDAGTICRRCRAARRELDRRRSRLRHRAGRAALAPFVARVIAVDRSGDMLQAARRRLRDFAQRRSPARRARSAADRRCRARRRDADAGAASRAGPGGGACRGGARDAQRRPVARHRHAAARSRGIPAADGPRLARLRRGADAQAARRIAGFDTRDDSHATLPADPDARKGRRCSSQGHAGREQTDRYGRSADRSESDEA